MRLIELDQDAEVLNDDMTVADLVEVLEHLPFPRGPGALSRRRRARGARLPIALLKRRGGGRRYCRSMG
jgi:hypothetical protein